MPTPYEGPTAQADALASPTLDAEIAAGTARVGNQLVTARYTNGLQYSNAAYNSPLATGSGISAVDAARLTAVEDKANALEPKVEVLESKELKLHPDVMTEDFTAEPGYHYRVSMTNHPAIVVTVDDATVFGARVAVSHHEGECDEECSINVRHKPEGFSDVQSEFITTYKGRVDLRWLLDGYNLIGYYE